MKSYNMKSNKVLQSGIWYVISNFLIKGMALITTPLFTRLLTKTDYGNYSNYISWLGILQILTTLNIQPTLISGKYDYKENFNKYIFSVLTMSTTSVVIWMIIMNLFSAQTSAVLSMDIGYINWMFLYFIFIVPVTLYQVKERFAYEYKKTVAISLFIAVSTTLVSLFFVLKLQNKFAGRIIGSALPTIIIGLILYISMAVKAKGIDLKCWKYALPICLPYIPHLLSMTILGSVDRVMITKMCGLESTAIYSVAYACGSIVTIIITSLNEAYSPWLADKLANNQIEKIRSFSYIYVGIFSFLAVGMILIAPEILFILGGNAYMEAKYVMSPVAMGCVCQFLYTMFVNIEQFKKKTLGMAIASILAASLNFILNLIFIPRFGYIAAAYTTLVGYLLLLFAHMFLVRKLQLQRAYNFKFIICVVGIMCLAMIGIQYLYEIIFIRVFIIFIYLIIAIILFIKYKSKLFGLYKRSEQ